MDELARAQFLEKIWDNDVLPIVEDLHAIIPKLLRTRQARRQAWSKTIADLKDLTIPPTIVAVCGNTGAGKSSLINAVLDMDILPTGGVRACTSCAIEVGYHTSRSIKAEIVFLTTAEWRQELSSLLAQIQSENVYPGTPINLDGENGVAWAKMKAVYPTITTMRNDLAALSEDDILALPSDLTVYLDTVKHIEHHHANAFLKELKEYTATQPLAASPWPLICSVKIKCNSKALRSGVVLVDLPGENDANAARQSIGKNYLEHAENFWIVTPITRAVDDSSTQASKSDDMEISDIIQSLELAQTYQYKFSQQTIQRLENKLIKLQENEKKEILQKNLLQQLEEIIEQKFDSYQLKFSSLEDTQIPRLQQKCDQITSLKCSHSFQNAIKLFSNTLTIILAEQENSRLDHLETQTMLEKWRSQHSLPSQLRLFLQPAQNNCGIALQLQEDFPPILSTVILSLKNGIKKNLYDVMEHAAQAGASTASKTCQRILDSLSVSASTKFFAQEGIVKNRGTQINLNEELSLVYTSHIVKKWNQLFGSTDKYFSRIETKIDNLLRRKVHEIEQSAVSNGMKDTVKRQGEIAIEEARDTLERIVEKVDAELQKKQKGVSRIIISHIKSQLARSYRHATTIRGKGSVGDRKEYLLAAIEEKEVALFEDANKAMLQGLQKMVDEIGEILEAELDKLAEQFEGTMTSIWDAGDDPNGQDPALHAAIWDLYNRLDAIKERIETSEGPAEED